MNFFKPKIHKFLEGDGVIGLEFPLVNYIPAVCYKLFGFNEAYYRGFVLVSMVFGLLFFFLMINCILKNWFLSFGLTLSAYCSPVMLYYSNNFMPDITSLSFELISFYFLFRNINADRSSNKNWLGFWIFAVLAALIKATSIAVIFTVLALVALDYFRFFKNYRNGVLFKNKIKLTIFLFLGVITVISWYVYSHFLVSNQKTAAFAMSVVRVTDWETADMVWQVIKNNHKYEYYPYETYILFLSIIGLLIIGYKYVNRVLFATTLIVTLGNLCFVYFFFYQFKDHDYYIVAITTSIYLLYYTFADFLTKVSTKHFKFLPFLFLIILFFNLKESIIWTKKDNVRRYDPENIRYFDNSMPYDDLEPKLRKLGIKRTDKTLTGFETGWCNGLYKMDQLGYTFTELSDSGDIKELLTNYDFKYMVLTDSVKFNHIYPNNFKDKIIATHRGLIIYKLK